MNSQEYCSFALSTVAWREPRIIYNRGNCHRHPVSLPTHSHGTAFTMFLNCFWFGRGFHPLSTEE